MIKLDVISGFLGSGKTTVIKKLFESGFAGEKVVLIENEFGEIGIDGAFLKGAGVEIKEINSGCICCSLVGDFAESLKEVIKRFSPDRIIVEPSGVGKLSDIIIAITKVDAPLQINVLATVVDGPKAKVYLKNFGEFFLNQVDSAETILINKIDKMDEEKLVEVVNMVKERNPKAVVISTPISAFSSSKLKEILENNVLTTDELMAELKMQMEKEEAEEHHHHHDDDDEEECCCHHHHDDDEEECCCHHHHHNEDEECECHHHHHDEDEECECHHHHDEDEECECHHHHEGEEGEHHHHHHHHHHDADEIFSSWGIETPRSISKAQLEQILKALAEDSSLGIIVRSKGILKANDNDLWYYFDFVSGDYEIRLGNPDYTGRVCVIGSQIDEGKIAALFNPN